MKKLFPILLVVVGLAFLGGGIGVALGALTIPALARTFRIEPVLVREAA